MAYQVPGVRASHDPEVLADLELRAASLRDPSRSRKEARWDPPIVVGTWRCRTCASAVGVTAEAAQRVAIFDAILGRRGEAALDTDAVMFCDPCRGKHTRLAALRRREEVDRLALAIRELKACDDDVRQRELVKQLEALRCPDLEGLVHAVTKRAASKTTKASRAAV